MQAGIPWAPGYCGHLDILCLEGPPAFWMKIKRHHGIQTTPKAQGLVRCIFADRRLFQCSRDLAMGDVYRRPLVRTLFAWYTGASWFVSAMALTILTAIYLKGQGLPGVRYHRTPARYRQYMFAFSIFWTYLWFSQYMLIWYANVEKKRYTSSTASKTTRCCFTATCSSTL